MAGFLTSTHGVFTGAVRPFSAVRGAGRLCRLVNLGFLEAGVPPIRTVRMRDGIRMRIDLRSLTEWYASYSGRYDDEVISLICRLLARRPGNFLDVGGNIGMYAVRVSAHLPPGMKTYCFEPMPSNARRIRENADANDLSERIELYRVALSDRSGTAELVLREDFERGASTGNASIAISPEADRSFQRMTVKLCRFDDVATEAGFGEIPVVKVDIEGHEDFFLKGALTRLARDRPVIITEINNWFYEKRGTTSSTVFAQCFPANYRAALLTTRRRKSGLSDISIEDLAALRKVQTCIFYPEEQRDLLYSALA